MFKRQLIITYSQEKEVSEADANAHSTVTKHH